MNCVTIAAFFGLVDLGEPSAFGWLGALNKARNRHTEEGGNGSCILRAFQPVSETTGALWRGMGRIFNAGPLLGRGSIR